MNRIEILKWASDCCNERAQQALQSAQSAVESNERADYLRVAYTELRQARFFEGQSSIESLSQ